MSVILTSFKKAKKYHGDKYSVAIFQPKRFNYASLPFLSPIDSSGRRIRLENCIDPAINYVRALKEAYQSRWHIIKQWLNNLKQDKTIVLCCWCPYSDRAKEEIQKFGMFYCHNGLIAKMITKHRPDISIIMDDDRNEQLFDGWHPSAKMRNIELPIEQITF